MNVSNSDEKSTSPKTDFSGRFGIGLLLLMVLIWGLVWPFNKVGLQYTSAFNYIELRLIFGAAAAFLIALCTGNLVLPKLSELPIILSVGLFQMGLMMVLSNYGLSLVGAGRATFLTFTTSLWIIPLSFIIHRKISRLEIFSFCIGILGTLLLLEPWHPNFNDPSHWKGPLILVASSISWSIGILCARHMPWPRPPIQLLPWQVLSATLFTIAIASLNGVSLIPQTFHPLFLTSFLYSGSVSIAIGYWIMILISKNLPPSVTSLGLLFVPILSLAISCCFLEEPIAFDFLIAIAFIIAAILMHIRAERRRA